MFSRKWGAFPLLFFKYFPGNCSGKLSFSALISVLRLWESGCKVENISTQPRTRILYFNLSRHEFVDRHATAHILQNYSIFHFVNVDDNKSKVPTRAVLKTVHFPSIFSRNASYIHVPVEVWFGTCPTRCTSMGGRPLWASDWTYTVLLGTMTHRFFGFQGFSPTELLKVKGEISFQTIIYSFDEHPYTDVIFLLKET